jgi:hypothetical protein
MPWPPSQNPAEFLGGFSTIFFYRVGLLAPRQTPHPGGPGLCIYIPRGRLATQFSRLLRQNLIKIPSSETELFTYKQEGKRTWLRQLAVTYCCETPRIAFPSNESASQWFRTRETYRTVLLPLPLFKRFTSIRQGQHFPPATRQINDLIYCFS